MLKFQDKFTVGQTIKAHDFRPMEGRPECYIEGVITEVNMSCDSDGWGGYAAYVIDITFDSWDEEGTEDGFLNRGSRVGGSATVPMEVSFDEFDERISLVENVA